MSKFYFYKIGRHFVLCDCKKSERYKITMLRKNMFKGLPYNVLVKRKIVCVVANTRDAAVDWLKTKKWSEL